MFYFRSISKNVRPQALSRTVVANKNTATKKSFSSIYTNKCFYCNTASGLADTFLQESFDGLLPRVRSIQSLINGKQQRQNFTMMLQNGILSSNLNFFNKMILYSDLQNPLLSKYHFDVAEFLTGAEEAFQQVSLAISSRNVCNHHEDTTENKLLKASLSPRLYEACIEVSTHLKQEGCFSVIENIDVQHVTLDSVMTRVFSSSVNIADENTLQYTEGSVIAKVDVCFEAHEEYRFGRELKLRSTTSQWTFESCISGQDEPDWRITAFDGVGV